MDASAMKFPRFIHMSRVTLRLALTRSMGVIRLGRKGSCAPSSCILITHGLTLRHHHNIELYSLSEHEELVGRCGLQDFELVNC